MTAKTKARLPNGKDVRWKASDFPTVYSNLIAFGLTPFDINVTFGQIGDSTATEVEGLPQVKVVLSPEQAANLMKLLGVALTAYVEGNGTLRSSGAVNVEEVTAQLRAQKKLAE